jgi:hypothetical protein
VPKELEKLNELIKMKGILALQFKCEEIKSKQLANVHGVIGDIYSKEKEICDKKIRDKQHQQFTIM